MIGLVNISKMYYTLQTYKNSIVEAIGIGKGKVEWQTGKDST